MAAAELALEKAPKNRRLMIETDSRWALGELTTWQKEHESTGYIGAANAELTKAAVARLRSRHAHTAFKWIKGHAGHDANERADRLAGAAATRDTPDAVNTAILPELRVTGARLDAMTQALAYKAIRARKELNWEARNPTARNMAQIETDLEDAFNIRPTHAGIWTATRNPAITLECQYFLWMLIHDAYKIGTYWLKESFKEEQRRRADCQRCGYVETMHHILFDCECEGQATVWRLAEQLWKRSGKAWPGHSLGIVAGAGCKPHRTADGRPITGLNRLWAILISESAKLIWNLRCERVIQHDNNKEFSAREVEERWYAALEFRLNDDRHATNVNLGKRALSQRLVDRTWKSVVADYESLPSEWTENTGVLVGIKRGDG
ncbi:hypothetical protein HDZ31DRAFT_29326 [Schizophyllum fasciatum]